MATDLLARGLAASLRDSNMVALVALADLPGRFVPAAIVCLSIGSASYLCDGLATAALAAAHPRCCAQSADGRYWRLAPSDATVTFEQCGATGSGNDLPAMQAAIDYAVQVGIPRVAGTLPAYELWEPVYGFAEFPADAAEFYARPRTLKIPACAQLEIDFGGARITLTGPTGGDRFPGQAVTGGIWLGGFITVAGIIDYLRIANVDVEGGFTGDTHDMDDVNLYDKGFMVQDWGDASYGEGVGFGTLEMENVVLHGFGGEIMYDNSSRFHLSRDCHFYNSGHSCWNVAAYLQRAVVYNVQAGRSRIVAEVIGGYGHTYIGGRFYEAGTGGAAFIGSEFLDGEYNVPNRSEERSPPYIQFIGTRFEDFSNAVYLGSWSRGSIDLTDAGVLLAAGFVSAGSFQDVDLDIRCTADRAGAINAVTVIGPETDTGEQAHNINIRLHCSRTKLAESEGGYVSVGFLLANLLHAPSCTFKVDGQVRSPFQATGTGLAGFALPLVDTVGCVGDGQPMSNIGLGVSGDITHTITERAVNLYPTGAGTFNLGVTDAIAYTHGQRFRFMHDGSGSADRIVSFAKNGTGMRLSADRTLRRAGEYLELEYSAHGAIWVEAAYMGQGA